MDLIRFMCVNNFKINPVYSFHTRFHCNNFKFKKGEWIVFNNSPPIITENNPLTLFKLKIIAMEPRVKAINWVNLKIIDTHEANKIHFPQVLKVFFISLNPFFLKEIIIKLLNPIPKLIINK